LSALTRKVNQVDTWNTSNVSSMKAKGHIR
jgi:hypothetical protein